MAQAFGVKTWRQHVRVVDQGPWQQRHRRGEGSEDPDDVGVWGQLLGTSLGSSVSVRWDKREGSSRYDTWEYNSLRPQSTLTLISTHIYTKCVPGAEQGAGRETRDDPSHC